MKKILHIVESFDGQAVESWLYQMMCHMQNQEIKFDWTFFVTLGKVGKFDDRVRNTGGKIIYSQVPLSKKINFVRSFRSEVLTGRFDIVHSHHDVMSAIYFIALMGLPVRKKIIHIHNTTLSLPTNSFIKKIFLREPMRQACIYWADTLIGVSKDALNTFQRGGNRNSQNNLVIHCGINTALFRGRLPNKKLFIQSLKLPKNANILLFVGRMTDDKNPLFVIEILRYLNKVDPTVCAVFAGIGPLELEVKKRVLQESLESRVRVLGWHDDIPKLMQLCDILVWPGKEHIKEGLGLAVVEAQAAGLSVIMSLNVPEEAIVVPELVDVLPLADGPSAWAKKIFSKLSRPKLVKNVSLSKVEASSFTINRSTTDVLALYDQ